MTDVLEIPKLSPSPPSSLLGVTKDEPPPVLLSPIITITSDSNAIQDETVEKEPIDKPPDLMSPVEATKESQVLLERNSTIPVNIDDLNEGFIVVSYTHNNNVYQGVLLQLNRERGIPCGISFPRESSVTGNIDGAADIDSNEPNQTSPINQRNTYLPNGGADNKLGPKSRVALRRVIKPPARYKNSRNNLKLRTRPVLCYKCRVLCEEKNPTAPNSNDDSNESTEKKSTTAKNEDDFVTGVTTRRGYASYISKLTKPDNSTTASNGTDKGSVPVEQKPAPEVDFSFTSVGSKGIVENYWKRPFYERRNESKVISTANCNASHSLTSSLSVALPKLVLSKALTSGSMSKSSTTSTKNTHLVETLNNGHTRNTSTALNNSSTKNPILLKTLTSSSKYPELKEISNKSKVTTKSQKAKSRSLKVCINKLKAKKCKDNRNAGEEDSNKNHKALSPTAAATTANSNNHDKNTSAFRKSPSPSAIRYQISQTPNKELIETINGNINCENGSHIDKHGGRKRSSTVPVRFRDHTYMTKNDVFGFKRRRVGEEDNCISHIGAGFQIEDLANFGNDIPSLPGYEDGNQLPSNSTLPANATSPVPSSEGLELIQQQNDGLNEASSSPSSQVVVSSNCISSSSFSCTTTTASTSSSSSPVPSTSTGGLTDSTSNKTPVIKITFGGTSGNGVVVKIPPKQTQRTNSATKATTSTNEENSKAVRKALKKAKKEAKKKRSMSFESALPSCSSSKSNTNSFDMTRSTSIYAVSSSSANTSSASTSTNRLLESPPPPVLNREYPTPSEQSSSDNSNSAHRESAKSEPSKSLVHVFKKKKKDKRKKHSKGSSKEHAEKTGSSSFSFLPKLEPAESCSSSSGSNMNVQILSDDEKLRRLYHPLENRATDEEEDLNISAPLLKNELLEPLQNPSADTTAVDKPERLCLSLKRLDSNSDAYVSCSSSSSSKTKAVSANINVVTDTPNDDSEVEPETSSESRSKKPGSSTKKENQTVKALKKLSKDEANNNNNESSDNDTPAENEDDAELHVENQGAPTDSLDFYSTENPPCTFRKGDLIWGKLSGCPWWPGKIVDILYVDGDETDIRAKVFWYQAATQSFMHFSMVVPFEEFFETKYNRNRRRGTYKQAVREALIETHSINPDDLPSD